jgi:hypothetical protein
MAQPSIVGKNSKGETKPRSEAASGLKLPPLSLQQ